MICELALLCWVWVVLIAGIHRLTGVPTHDGWRRVYMTLDDLAAKVAALDAVVGSAVTLLGDLKVRLDAALASNDPAKLQAVADAVDAAATTLSGAVSANTPPPA